jgi:membrane fusion protein, multidrug efflux system
MESTSDILAVKDELAQAVTPCAKLADVAPSLKPVERPITPPTTPTQPAEAKSAPDAAPAKTGSAGTRVWIVTLVLASVTLSAAYRSGLISLHGSTVSTDNAYLRADVTTLSAKVDGYVKRVVVKDYQSVKSGEPLVEIDDQDYLARVDSAKAELASSKATLGSLRAQVAQQEAFIRAAKATVVSSNAGVWRSQRDRDRATSLFRERYTSEQTADQKIAESKQQAAQLDRETANLEAQQQLLASLNAQFERQEADIAVRKASLTLAELNESYTIIRAPADGYVHERLVKQGQYVRVGSQLISHVTRPEIWVIANFKETQLTNVRAGQRARVRIDMIPDKSFSGHVIAMAPGTGGQFALIPPDNATGNFTKVVQRVPVKIVFDSIDIGDPRLRPGLSASVEIDMTPVPE